MEETSPVNCVLNRYILFVNMYSSVLFMVLVSLDRYLLLCHPRRNHVLLTPRVAVLASILTWVFVNIEMTPLIYYAIKDNARTNGTMCHDFASLSQSWGLLVYSLGLTLLGYILPLVALFLCTRKIT
ncbi:succinate receptor 1-like [Clupea harengus]|uniref:Succinate receptor 1-like n=1 Tax=Clupea harengus TaxID=7950 RepID=A0A6P8FSY1_CLUHA|nr:succinate receptor 1-like [Clupea harengus]